MTSFFSARQSNTISEPIKVWNLYTAVRVELPNYRKYGGILLSLPTKMDPFVIVLTLQMNNVPYYAKIHHVHSSIVFPLKRKANKLYPLEIITKDNIASLKPNSLILEPKDPNPCSGAEFCVDSWIWSKSFYGCMDTTGIKFDQRHEHRHGCCNPKCFLFFAPNDTPIEEDHMTSFSKTQSGDKYGSGGMLLVDDNDEE